MSEQGDSHRDSVKRVYSSYGRSSRKRRAWAADNPGNAAMRAEVLAHLLRLVRPEIAGSGEILDDGCGRGWLLRALVEAGAAAGRVPRGGNPPRRGGAGRPA